jgi:hypothetical protein
MKFRTGIDIGCLRGLSFARDGTFDEIMLIKSRGLGNWSINNDSTVSNGMLVENVRRRRFEVSAFLCASCETILGNSSSWLRICSGSDDINGTVI